MKHLYDLYNESGTKKTKEEIRQEAEQWYSREYDCVPEHAAAYPGTQEDAPACRSMLQPSISISDSISVSDSISDSFKAFWSAYPRKENQSAAADAFSQLKPDAELLQKMLAAIKMQKASQQWTKDGGQYIPAPANWLKGQRWKDELPKAVPKRTSETDYQQREYTEEELLAVSDDLIEEARQYRGRTV